MANGIYNPQDYSIEKVSFTTSTGKIIDLTPVMLELSYYEDIYSFVSSGHLTIIDAQGFIELLRLTGNEYIDLKFGKIKGAKNVIDVTFRVYKIGDREPTGNMNGEVYPIYFCSEELLLSEQTKISKSYKGQAISDIVNDILIDKLKVTKPILIEPTTGTYNFVIPRMKPLEAISWLSVYARPATHTVGADMLFFETKTGFKFRSLQSMFKDNAYQTYFYQAKNLSNDLTSMQDKVVSVLEYEIIKAYDALNEINSGTLSNRLISVDPVARSYKTTDFDYNDFKSKAVTLNNNGPTNNLQNRLGKTPTQNYDGNLKVSISNANQIALPYIKENDGGDTKDSYVETFVPNRTAQISLANYTTIKIVIPGDPGLTAGKTVNFNLMSLKPGKQKELDKFYSGKYLVSAVRHVIIGQASYQTVLELSKDSTATSYGAVDNSNPTLRQAITE